MQTQFTPIAALLGGALIGLAATLLYAGLGRIAGISGLLNQALEQPSGRGCIGWGIAGYCPGPGLASLSRGGEAIWFVLALLAGSQLARLLAKRP